MPLSPPGRFHGAVLRHTREAAGLSRPQLAARMGVNVGLIKSWETKGVCPTVSNITRAAQALGLEVNDLYTPDVASKGSLRDLRVAAGMTQYFLAQRLGVRQGLVSQWERSRARPTWEQILRYAAVLDVEPAVIGAAVALTEPSANFALDGPVAVGPGADPADGSVVVHFHATPAMVARLTHIAAERGVSVADLCGQIVGVFVAQH